MSENTANLIQLYSDKNNSELAYPVVHRMGVVADDGTNEIETIEKK